VGVEGAGTACKRAAALHGDTGAHTQRTNAICAAACACRLEASFPAAAVRQSERRQRAARVKPHTFFNA
jgi:hypothetical protein